MCEIEMGGRLGNQLFQYAAVRNYMEQYNKSDLKINFSKLVYGLNFENELKNFNVIDYEEIEPRAGLNIKQKILIKFMNFSEDLMKKFFKGTNVKIKKFELLMKNFLMKNGVYYFNYGYVDFLPSKYENIIFKGTFESAKYFENIENKIREEFTPKHEKLKKNLELYNKIENTESVCVTIRRGDFLTDEHKSIHYVCTPEYFYKSINKINELIQNPQYIVFSDDVEWCKNNMNFPEGTLYESGDDPVWEKLRLMYECKHFIISNSTFSWWAQFLSRNENKKVIAPTKWKNTFQNNDIYQDNWILIEP